MTATEAWQLEWTRPLRPGLPIATAPDRCGAIGGIVFDRATGTPLLLGAKHVLFDSTGTSTRVWQPAPCGQPGCDCNLVARALRGCQAVQPWRGQYYFLDAAVAALEDEVEWEPSPTLEGVVPMGGMRVHKVGPATGMTEGIVVNDHHLDSGCQAGLTGGAPNQLLIRPIAPHAEFAALGDSGSVVRDESGHAVGVLWGADGAGRGVACPIAPVLETLQVDFVRKVA